MGVGSWHERWPPLVAFNVFSIFATFHNLRDPFTHHPRLGLPVNDSTVSSQTDPDDHLTWVRTRMTIDKEFADALRHGFSLITAGFSSFALFEGLTLSEPGHPNCLDPSP
jgi:hypothetical protein